MALWAESDLQDSFVRSIVFLLWEKWKDCPCNTLATLRQLLGDVRWYLQLRVEWLGDIFLPELVC